MEPQITIQYRQIPVNIFDDFKPLEKVPVQITMRHDKKEYFNATGGPVDIIIYIEQHLTELIVNGLVVASVFELLKMAVAGAWKKLKSYYQQKTKPLRPDKHGINLVFKISEDKSLTFTLSGEITQTDLTKLTEHIFEYLKNKPQLEQDLANKAYHNNISKKPSIRMRYNVQKGIYEPVNSEQQLQEIRKAIDEAKNRINE
ncbi:MAG: hypothetical protein V4539_17230 [Bacteroidota bacterium]